jgi:hypothetical protein
MKEFWSSFVKAQAEMQNPIFDSRNPAFNNSKYASLSAVRTAVLPILNKYGISVIQELKRTSDGVECVTILIHQNGEIYTSSPLEIPSKILVRNKEGKIVEKNDAHCIGSASTYARRYQLQSLCGVVGDDDEDGNNVSHKPTTNKPTLNKIYNKPEDKIKSLEILKLTDEQAQTLADKTIYYSDKLTECKTLEDLGTLFLEAKKEIKPYERSKEYENSINQIIAVKNVMKAPLSPKNLQEEVSNEEL